MAVFRDRIDAGKQLAGKLSAYRGRNPLVLAIPRGAIPLGDVVARELKGQLDLVLVHKIGAPGNPEFAIGAVAEDGKVVLGGEADFFSVSEEYVKRAAAEEVAALQAKRQLYSPYTHAIPRRDRVVILVDDGIATGQTMLAAVRAVREDGPAEIVVAAPVASTDAYEALEKVADRLAVVAVEERFGSVSRFYETFAQVSDAEVVEILARMRSAS
ncbi:MAG: phosphoribosyltransferase [Deltaproteobacteria bacterium]|nr:phosphoribosyltransferase [Deltaproteobacteria bacterium]